MRCRTITVNKQVQYEKSLQMDLIAFMIRLIKTIASIKSLH